MADGTITSLVLYDSVLFDIGHHVRRWADSVSRNYTVQATALAPVNKRPNKSHLSVHPIGSLKASISGQVDRIGPKHIQIVIHVNVPYALYVIEGTQGPITPTHSKNLRLPWNPGFSPAKTTEGHETRFPAVSGQRANPFLKLAHTATARIHPSLRGLENQLFEQF